MTASSWLDGLVAHGVAGVGELLGLEAQGRAWGPCPACGEGRRGSSDRRAPLGLTPDGTGWRCQRCSAGGDAATLVALAVVGAPKPDRAGWGRVRAWAVAHGLVAGDAPGDALRTRLPLAKPRPLEVKRPDPLEVRALWRACHGVAQDLEVARWLRGRGLDPALVEDLDLARALPLEAPLPAWAGTARTTWSRCGYRLITPLRGPGEAAPVALRARRVGAEPWPKAPKALAPKGHTVAGLVFADPLAARLLAGDAAAAALVAELGLVVAEGEPDYLVWSTRYGVDGGLERAPAVFGVEAGAWSEPIAKLVPSGTTVRVRVHQDEAGDCYAERINNTLGDRCRVLRGAALPAEEAALA